MLLEDVISSIGPEDFVEHDGQGRGLTLGIGVFDDAGVTATLTVTDLGVPPSRRPRTDGLVGPGLADPDGGGVVVAGPNRDWHMARAGGARGHQCGGLHRADTARRCVSRCPGPGGGIRESPGTMGMVGVGRARFAGW